MTTGQDILFHNIRRLHGAWDLAPPRQPLRGEMMHQWPVLNNAWIYVKEGLIHSLGCGEPPRGGGDTLFIDLQGALVVPGFCDSHTHAVFAAWRWEEYLLKLQGMSYAEIAARGGGILNSARRLAQMDEDELFEVSLRRVQDLIGLGTTALEIKSGYGLDLENELKMLRVISRLCRHLKIPVKATCLAAHALPEAYKNRKKEYIEKVCGELLPFVAAEQLADYVDVFCETGFFDETDTEIILKTAAELGFGLKVHAHQLGRSGGVRVGVRWGAASVDHLEYMNEEDMDLLATSAVMPTALPIAAWFLNLPYPPVRQMIQKGLPVAIATDFNPGSAPSGSMWMALALACTGMKMQPSEAFAAATFNGAWAMGLQGLCGALSPGYRADFLAIHGLEDLSEVPYRFHSALDLDVFVAGEKWSARS